MAIPGSRTVMVGADSGFLAYKPRLTLVANLVAAVYILQLPSSPRRHYSLTGTKLYAVLLCVRCTKV